MVGAPSLAVLFPAAGVVKANARGPHLLDALGVPGFPRALLDKAV